jgi:hypothetical protein
MIALHRASTLVGVLLALCPVLLLGGCGGGDEGRSSDGASGAGPAHAGAGFASASAEESGKPAQYGTSGRILADSGFRPRSDGFSFENYGPGYQDLTALQMQDLFGPRVCALGEGIKCVLTPPAQVWMTEVNQAMAGGHCFGFSVTSLMIFQGILSPFDYGGLTTPALPLIGNIALQQRIAESFALQVTDRVVRAAIEGTPNRVLDQLITRLKRGRGETYTLGILRRDKSAGHAITPYAVEDRGHGTVMVLVYDNNYPGITRAVAFDRNKNAWSFDASANPSEPSDLFAGDARTKSAVLFPTKPGVGIHPCPFCLRARAGGPATAGYDLLSLTADPVNHAHLLIGDREGRKTGYVEGRLVNEIPGASVIPTFQNQNWRESPEPRYRIPSDLDVSILVDGATLDAPDTESVSVIGPGHAAVVREITLRPGEQNRLDVSQNGTTITYRTEPGFAQSPRLELGLDRAKRDYKFAITPTTIEGGSTLAARARPGAERLTVDAGEVKNTVRYALDVSQIRRSAKPVFSRRVVRLPAGSSTQFHYGR